MKATLIGTLLLAVFLSAPSFAGDQLSIRLVEAKFGGDDRQSGPGLEDVIDILKRSLASANYHLVDSCVVTLPADGTQTLGEYTLKYSGTRKSLSVTVLRFGKQVLRTASVPVQANKPFIIGGLPGKSGLMMLVFLAR